MQDIMFFCFKYFVLIVTFNHCCGASNLVRTTIYGSPPRAQPAFSLPPHVGPMNTAANHRYPLYEIPFSYHQPSRDELQYAASFSQGVQMPQLVHTQMAQAAQVAQAPPQLQRFQQVAQVQQAPAVAVQPHTGSVVNANVVKPRGLSNFDQQRLSAVQREPQRLPVIRLKEGQQLAGQRIAKQEHSQKQMMPMLLKAEQTASTIQPMLTHEHHVKSNFAIRTRPVMRVPKMDPEWKSNLSEPIPRVHTIGFNWPKANRKVSDNQDNSTQSTQGQHRGEANSRLSNQLRIVNNDVDTKLRQVSNDQGQAPISTGKARYGEIQQNIRYEVTEPPTPETEIFRETNPPTIPRPTIAPTTLAEAVSGVDEQDNSTKEADFGAEVRMERKESLSSVDSEVNYQTQYYDHNKPQNHFQPSLQNNDQDNVSEYGIPIENQDVPVPENEVTYPVAEPEHLSAPTPEDSYYDENDKELSDHNEPKLKMLLEQFIQQLELLKYVAAKELQKTGVADDYSNYESPKDSTYDSSPKDGEVIRTTVAEPSVSRTGLTYDEYQNTRSFEQNYSNSDSKAYKDTNEKRYGRKHPCKKPFHLGAMPNLAPQYSRS